jgi:predicted nucleotidyltransferase
MEQAFELIKELKNSNLKFVVIGGVAVVLYGVRRATFDIDILIPPDENEILILLQVLKQYGYKRIYKISKTQDRKDKFLVTIDKLFPKEMSKHWALRFKNDIDLDVLIAPNKTFFDFIWEYRIESEVSNVNIPTPSLLDLIRLKEWSNRQRDKEDVKALRHLLQTRKI